MKEAIKLLAGAYAYMFAVCGVLVALIFVSNLAVAGSRVLGGTHSRAAIQGACDKVGGQPYGTANKSGDYGCYTDKGIVTCKENGVCTGWCQNCASAASGKTIPGSQNLWQILTNKPIGPAASSLQGGKAPPISSAPKAPIQGGTTALQ